MALVKPHHPLALSRRVLIPGAIPGEIVNAETQEREDGTLLGELTLVDVPSPHRLTKIPCPHCDSCGACSLMHVKYGHQLVVKQRATTALFRTAGLDVKPSAVAPSPSLGFRSTVSLVVQEASQRDKRKERSPRGLNLGYYHKLSSQIVTPISSCVVSTPPINSLIPKLQILLQEFPTLRELRHVTIKATRQPEVLVMLQLEGKKKSKRAEKRENRRKSDSFSVVNEGADSTELVRQLAQKIKDSTAEVKGVFLRTRETWTLLAGCDAGINEEICGMSFRLSPGSFFQTNLTQAEKIYSRVLNQVSVTDSVIEAYSGVGVLTCLLATRARDVIGIECVEAAVKDSIYNAEKNNLEGNCNFICGDAEVELNKIMSERKKKKTRTDVVVLNPPRTGVKESILECLGDYQPKKIVYISCNAETLSRDILHLMSTAHYSVEVDLFDMFPHTMHTEAVAVLRLKS